jgi:hypothetical protein
VKRDIRLLFGPLAAGILGVGIVGLGLLVPDYSQVRQTVSEIGEMDSPARIPFAIMLCCVTAAAQCLRRAGADRLSGAAGVRAGLGAATRRDRR